MPALTVAATLGEILHVSWSALADAEAAAARAGRSELAAELRWLRNRVEAVEQLHPETDHLFCCHEIVMHGDWQPIDT